MSVQGRSVIASLLLTRHNHQCPDIYRHLFGPLDGTFRECCSPSVGAGDNRGQRHHSPQLVSEPQRADSGYVEKSSCECQMDTEEQALNWVRHSCRMISFVGWRV
jgi:hypothetical protein